MVLSHIEQSRSVRPSSVLTAYLLFSALLDGPQVRTLYLQHDNGAIAAVLLATVGLKLALLLLDSLEKKAYLTLEYQRLSPESLGGILNRSFMWWLNGLKRVLET
jgi:hypothetical protein